jgi:hypothetical protein
VFNPTNSGQLFEPNVKNQLIQNPDFVGLRHTGQRLKSLVPEFQATDPDLSEIRSAIDEMSQSLEEERLSQHTKEVLRERIEKIREAVEEYHLWGVAGLNQAFADYSATLIFDASIQNELKSSATSSGGKVAKRALKLGATLFWLIGALNGLHDVKQNYLPTIERLLLPTATQHSNAPTTQPPFDTETPLPAASMRVRKE